MLNEKFQKKEFRNFKLCPLLNSMIKPQAIFPFLPEMGIIALSSVSHLLAPCQWSDCLLRYLVLVSKSPWLQLGMAAKCKSSDAGNSDVPKRSCAVPSFHWKEGSSWPSKREKKKDSYAEFAKIYGKNKSSILKLWRKSTFVLGLRCTSNCKSCSHSAW